MELTTEQLEMLATKVTEGTATDAEKLVYYEAIEKGLDELIALADQLPESAVDQS